MPQIYSFDTGKLIKTVEYRLPKCFVCNGTGKNLVWDWSKKTFMVKFGKCLFCEQGWIWKLVDRSLEIVTDIK